MPALQGAWFVPAGLLEMSARHDYSPPAYEADGKHVDAQTFYTLACNPARNVVVEACAGAGKTWLLVARILRILLDGCAPEAILAVTFTRKAAAEMQERLLTVLHELACASPEARIAALQQRGLDKAQALALQGQAQTLYQTLLQRPQGVRVRTFHAWFAQLLHAAPLALLQDLGLPADYALQEDTDMILERTWPRFYAALQAQQNQQAYAAYQALVNLYGRRAVQSLLRNTLARPVELALAQDKAMLTDAVQPWQKTLKKGFAYLQEVQDINQVLDLPEVQTLLQAAGQQLAVQREKTAQTAAHNLQQGLQAQDLSKVLISLLTGKGMPRKLPPDPTVQEAQDLLLEVAALQTQARAHCLQAHMATLCGLLLACYGKVKREYGWVDMGDIERAAHALLQDHTLSAWVQERLDASTRHILIDEFQDTSPLQWQTLLAWLSAYTGAGGGGDLRVFLVGDPKQSIYRFRGGQPEVFQAAKTFLQAPGWQALWLTCDHTRRNTQVVLGLVNTVMQAAQDQGQYRGFRAHSMQHTVPADDFASEKNICLPVQGVFYLPQIERPPKVATQKTSQDTQAQEHWRDSLYEPRYEEEETLRAQEARQAAQALAQITATGTPAHTIMVLARKRVALQAMALALREQGIAAQIVEKAYLQDQPAVSDILALWDALLYPWHHLSLAQALKSPLFRFSDSELLALARADTKGSWWQALRIQHADVYAQLERWGHLMRSLPPYDTLQAMYCEANVYACYARAVQPVQRAQVLAHLGALLQAALDMQGGRFLSAYGFLRALRQTPIKVTSAPDAEAVQLLTIHSAKGLEADVVVLLDTQSRADKKDSMSVVVQWPAHTPVPTRFAFVESEARPARSLQALLEQEEQAQQREELNALYVAMTRARHLLVVSSVQAKSDKHITWWQRIVPYAQPWPLPCPVAQTAPALDIATAFSLWRWPEQVKTEPEAQTQAMMAVTAPVVDSAKTATPAIAHQPQNNSDSAAYERVRCIGLAMHLVLQWAEDPTVAPVLCESAADTHTGLAEDKTQVAHNIGQERPESYRLLLQDLCTRFALQLQDAQQAIAHARAIRNAEVAWAWDRQQLLFAENEVELQYQGKTLRIDRLVRRADDGVWWVLDYKSAQQPQAQEALREQLGTYAAAVQALYPEDTVRAVFVNVQGKIIAPRLSTSTPG